MKCPAALATVPPSPEHTNRHHLCPTCERHWKVPADLVGSAIEPQGVLW